MNTIDIITFVIFGSIGSILLLVGLVGFFVVLYTINTYKKIKKSINNLNHFVELVEWNMDKYSLNEILSQFDKEFVFKIGSEVYFKCHKSHTSQYASLRNIILHRIELIETADKYKEELLQNIKNKT